MEFLKRIPIAYKGQLNDVKLINFTVSIDEVKKFVPQGIRIRSFENNLAMISMVNVKLTRMRPSFLPGEFSFAYQHIAFRLLVEDSSLNNGFNKGIFFLKSFTNKNLIAIGGNIFTNYRLTPATIVENGNQFSLEQGSQYIRYCQNPETHSGVNPELKEIIGSLDRAYSVLNNRLNVTIIQREKWPIEWIECNDFNTNFFETAKFQGAFRVKEMIPYTWLPPKSVV